MRQRAHLQYVFPASPAEIRPESAAVVNERDLAYLQALVKDEGTCPPTVFKRLGRNKVSRLTNS